MALIIAMQRTARGSSNGWSTMGFSLFGFCMGSSLLSVVIIAWRCAKEMADILAFRTDISSIEIGRQWVYIGTTKDGNYICG
jgi:hypothetical protein